MIRPARLLLTDTQHLSISEVRGAVGPLLLAEGFEDFGRDEEMIALVSRSGVAERTVSLEHEYTYLNKRRNLRVVLTDYTDLLRGRPTLPYVVPVGPFFELRIYEERPGGFSSSGKRLLAALQANLERSLDASVTLVTSPPETDDEEYWRVTVTNVVGGVLDWLIVFGIALLITGGVSRWVLKRVPIRANVKRGIFVVINTWLVTPLPFPAATVLVILLPNLFAIPWMDLDYYRRVQDVGVISFPIAFVLCTLLSLRMFRHPCA